MSSNTDRGADEAPPEKKAKVGETESPAVKFGITCAVCLNDVTDMTLARPCGHCFDKLCIQTSVARDDRCPTCRDAIGVLEFNFTPEGKFESQLVEHPDDQIIVISPDISIRRGRREGVTMAQVSVNKDALLIASSTGQHEETFAVDKEHKFHVPLAYLQPSGHSVIKLLIRMDGEPDHELVVPHQDDSENDDDDGVIDPGAEEVAASQSILRVLEQLRQQLTAMEALVGPGSDGPDDEEDEDILVSSAVPSRQLFTHLIRWDSDPVTNATAAVAPGYSPSVFGSDCSSESPDSDPAMSPDTDAGTAVVNSPDTSAQPPASVPEKEQIRLTVSPSVSLGFTYPNGILAKFVAQKMLILKLHNSDDNCSEVIRSGESVFMPEGIMMRTTCKEAVVREDGKEYPLSRAFKDLVSGMDQKYGYIRPVYVDDDDSVDDSSDDSDSE